MHFIGVNDEMHVKNLVFSISASYSSYTGEARSKATHGIELVVEVLTQCIESSIPTESLILVGTVQEHLKQVQNILTAQPSVMPVSRIDPTIRIAHTDVADRELASIIRRRTFDLENTIHAISNLRRKVEKNGELWAATDESRQKVFDWEARLCASDRATVQRAREIRDERSMSENPEFTSIVDALINKSEGNSAQAIRLLRDIQSPDARSVLLSILGEHCGARHALGRFHDVNPRANPDYLTGIGWRCWAIFLAREGRWEEAAKGLSDLPERISLDPALALFEGVVNAAMLVPDEYRDQVLDTFPVYDGIAPSIDHFAQQYHSRAMHCFQVAQRELQEFANTNLSTNIADWLTWISLMNPDAVERQLARADVARRMIDGEKAVRLMIFAWGFTIDFDEKKVRDYLQDRDDFGGLTNDEMLAQCLLFERILVPREYAEYLDAHFEQLIKFLPPATIVSLMLQALTRDGRKDRARAYLEENREVVGEETFAGMLRRIEALDASDAKVQLERRFNETGSLIDLANLISHFRSIEDDDSLRPLLFKRFEMTRTINHARELVAFLATQSTKDFHAILQLLDENPTITNQDAEMTQLKVQALLMAGRFSEAKKLNDSLLNKHGVGSGEQEQQHSI